MKVKFITSAALEYLRANLADWVVLFAKATPAELIARMEKAMPGENLFLESGYELPDGELILAKDSDSELENIRRIFLPLKALPPAVARDERLWAGMAITGHWEYVVNRWDIRELAAHDRKKAVNAVREHFLFAHNPRRSFTRNALSRLWWLGKMTYDESLSDPFRRTAVVMRDLGYIVDLLERNFSNNPRISAEFIDAVEDARRKVAAEGKVILRPELRILCKHLNMLGGVYILDTMTGGLIHDRIYAKAVAIARDPSAKPAEDMKESDDDLEAAV